MLDPQNINTSNRPYRSLYFEKQLPKVPQFAKSGFLKRASSQKQIQKFDLQNIIVRSTFAGMVCPLCETRYKAQEMMISHQDCSHSFCEDCLHHYLVYKISVSQEIVCPQQGCNLIIETQSLCFSNLPEQYKSKYEQFKLWKQTISNPSLKLCPTENCKGMINAEQSFKCNLCKTQFCPECMLKKHEGPCDVNFQNNFKDWKRCPNCSMFIQKDEGCNHITCRCSHQFCYVCLASWSEDHYQCGQDGGVPGIHREYLLPEDRLREEPRCKRIIYGILMLILLPIALVLLLAFFSICVVGGPAIALVVSPFVGICSNISQEYCQRCCPCWCIAYLLLVPIIMIGAVVASFFVITYNVGIVVSFIFWSYINTAFFLLCNNEQVQDPHLQEI